MGKKYFADFLGEYNGKEMIRAILLDNSVTKEQARAAVTTYCVLFDVEVDTRPWDDLMAEIFAYYNCFFSTYQEMDDYMCELLV